MKLGVYLTVLGLLGAMLSAPRIAQASSGSSFLETIGISTAVGMVLGASTLPFYDSPGSHISNILYGGSIGAAVGVGVCIYGWFGGSSSEGDDRAYNGQLNFSWFAQKPQIRTRIASANYYSVAQAPQVSRTSESQRVRETEASGFSRATGNLSSANHALFWTPVVSLTW